MQNSNMDEQQSKYAIHAAAREGKSELLGVLMGSCLSEVLLTGCSVAVVESLLHVRHLICPRSQIMPGADRA
jgi:hypothetical protein